MDICNRAADVNEEESTGFSNEILNLLLMDRTTRRNIIWATRDYEGYGQSYKAEYPITIDLITGSNSDIIQPRMTKEKTSKTNRTKVKAEVFTPAWVCNEQNNLIDSSWFGRPGVFNFTQSNGWVTNEAPVQFEDTRGRRWTDYIDAKRLEITCGEAPYLTSRYDMLTGNSIDVKDRIGLLDRKLRVANENTNNEEDWLKWTYRAYESIYGFEFQGDNLLLARKNLLYTFMENMQYKLDRLPVTAELKRAARIISWNVWQMDGLSFTVPFGNIEEQYRQLTLKGMDCSDRIKVYCKIHDWRSKVTLLYSSFLKENGE